MESLLIREEGTERTFYIDRRVVTIGRSGRSDIVLKDRNCSRQHCNIIKVGESWFAVDCDSHNGTFVNKDKTKKKELHHGDKISIGCVDIIFYLHQDKESNSPPQQSVPYSREKQSIPSSIEYPDSPALKDDKPMDEEREPTLNASMDELDEIEDIEDDPELLINPNVQELSSAQEVAQGLSSAQEVAQELGSTKEVLQEANVVKAPFPNSGLEIKISKDESIRKDIEKLKALHQKLQSKITSQTSGQEKLVKRFLIALIARGHCSISGDSSLAMGVLLPKMCHLLGLSHQYFSAMRSSEPPNDSHILFIDDDSHENLLHVAHQYSTQTSNNIPNPWMLVIAEQHRDSFLSSRHTFMIPLPFSNLTEEEELALLGMSLQFNAVEKPLASLRELISYQLLLDEIRVSSDILSYVNRITRATRPELDGCSKIAKQNLVQGVASIVGVWILRTAKARAALQGRDTVTANDIQSTCQYLIPSRLQLTPTSQKTGENSQTVFNAILNEIRQPADKG